MERDNKYLKSKIYKLKSELTDQYYIGSTVQRLCKRKAHHLEWYFRNEKPTTACEIIRLAPRKIVLELLEEYPCESSLQLRQKEQEYLDRFREDPNLVNKCNAYLSPESRKERMKFYMRQYRLKKKSQTQSEQE
ncbi:MAG: hypothetical protein ACOYNN_15010 [Terrimicrobiaceae bacterium]